MASSGNAIERSNEVSFETYFGGLFTWNYKCLGSKNMGLLHYLLRGTLQTCETHLIFVSSFCCCWQLGFDVRLCLARFTPMSLLNDFARSTLSVGFFTSVLIGFQLKQG